MSYSPEEKRRVIQMLDEAIVEADLDVVYVGVRPGLLSVWFLGSLSAVFGVSLFLARVLGLA